MGTINYQTAYQPNGVVHVITTGTTSVAQTTGISAGVRRVKISADATTFFRINGTGITTAATVNDFPIKATDTPIDYAVEQGDKFYAILASGTGKLYIQELA